MTSTMVDDTALLALAERARAALPVAVNGRIEKAVRLVQSESVELYEDGTATVLSESDGVTPYRVVGKRCACPDYTFQAPQGWCAHRIAVAMVQRLGQHAADVCTAAAQETSAPSGSICEPSAVPDATLGHPGVKSGGIPPQFVKQLHGKQFVLYAGLLAMAHERGLVSLSATFISVTPELALAEATAVFQDGRSFREAADATPQNVTAQVRPHFARMALVRSKARALRDALNIGIATLEELGEE